MKLPQPLLTKRVGRLKSLAAEGEDLVRNAETIPAEYQYSRTTGQGYEVQAAYQKINWPKFVEWRTKAATILAQVVPKGHVHYSAVEGMPALKPDTTRFQWGVSILRAIKDDLQEGFLDSLFSQIEAERLLAEGAYGNFDHIPAAVLAGAVLEKGL